MKHILSTILAGCCISATVAHAQLDTSPWHGVPTNPASGVIPSGAADFQYPDDVHAKALAKANNPTTVSPAPANAQQTMTTTAPTLPAYVALPPPKYDGPYRGGKLIVTKWDDYSLLQHLCKDPGVIACSYGTYDSVTGNLISCLILLGPVAHDNARVLRHEIGHCNGWTSAHEGAR